MKDLFINEINKIHNETLRNVCLAFVDVIPSYFWTIPASTSGKYHPECDLGEGGLVRHSIMVTTCGLDLLTSEMFVRQSPIMEDLVRIACLFHDSFKCGRVTEDGTYSEHTVFEHPRIASEEIRKFFNENDVDPLYTEMICNAIYTHMGKWCVDKYGDGEALSKPRTDFERLIHIADYMASRKYINNGIW